MFENAIEIASKFTRAIHTISRNYNSKDIQPGCSTLFFVNKDGWALTCGHVLDLLIITDVLLQKKKDFENERKLRPAAIPPKQWLRGLEQKYGIANGNTYEVQNLFINCFSGFSDFHVIKHPKYDVGLIKINDMAGCTVTTFPKFPENTSSMRNGKFLCRLGFPFPEFENFEYDLATDSIRWNNNPNNLSPWFPLDGMVTRFMRDETNIFGFELSTPGIKGHSGGPIFDQNGQVWGIQYGTAHHDLDFDVENMSVFRKGAKKKISTHSILNVGLGVHVDVIKTFMKVNNVSFDES